MWHRLQRFLTVDDGVTQLLGLVETTAEIGLSSKLASHSHNRTHVYQTERRRGWHTCLLRCTVAAGCPGWLAWEGLLVTLPAKLLAASRQVPGVLQTEAWTALLRSG